MGEDMTDGAVHHRLRNFFSSLVILVLAWMFVPNTSSATAKKVDLPGVLLASAALFLLVFPLIEGHSQDWSARIWLMLAGSAVLMVLFVVVERRTEQRTGSSLLPTASVHSSRIARATANLRRPPSIP